MKEIRLSKISIDNFKGCEHLVLDLAGLCTSIYGDNAAGKTTIYDALTWVLFGKDSRGQSSFEIKPLDETGAVRDHAAITCVEAVFLVDGEELALKRTYYEKWSTKRGSADASFDGNTSDFYVDGVPCKKYEFETAVSDVVEEDVFRMLTGVSFFCSDLDWKKRRELLFSVCGTMTDRDVMALDSRFNPLANACGKLSIDGLKKKLQAERKGLSGIRNDIPVRLDECKKTIAELSGMDYEALRTERDQRVAQKSSLEAELVKLENNALVAAKNNELGALRNDTAALENENRAYRQSQERTIHDPRPELTRQKAMLERQIARLESDVTAQESEAQNSQKEVDRCRNSWKAVNATVFAGGTCPTCGQALLADALQGAKDAFQQQKEKNLASIVAESERYKQRSASAKEKVSALTTELSELKVQLEETKKAITDFVPPSIPVVSDLPDYASKRSELDRKVFALDQELLRLSGESRSAQSNLRSKITILMEEIKVIEQSLAKEGVIRFTEERMNVLREDAKSAAEKIESIDSLLFLCEEFTRFQVQCIEESVNSRFHLAKFRLFVEQVNGGLSDCCDVTFNGVPYNSLNNGTKINIGMDVIETLSQHYGVRVPLFVDNAESVTKLYNVGAQVIRLVVSEQDKKVRCEYGA